MQEKGDLMRELEMLGVELKKSRDELDKSRDEVRSHNLLSVALSLPVGILRIHFRYCNDYAEINFIIILYSLLLVILIFFSFFSFLIYLQDCLCLTE